MESEARVIQKSPPSPRGFRVKKIALSFEMRDLFEPAADHAGGEAKQKDCRTQADHKDGQADW
jgi:hypothetical protein